MDGAHLIILEDGKRSSNLFLKIKQTVLRSGNLLIFRPKRLLIVVLLIIYYCLNDLGGGHAEKKFC